MTTLRDALEQQGALIKAGPFTWRRDDHDFSECWELVIPKGLRITHWGLKNYGGEPVANNGFSGWRLVSGGPFTAAGGWTSRAAAMQGVIPWLLDYYRDELRDRLAEAEHIKVALGDFLGGGQCTT